MRRLRGFRFDLLLATGTGVFAQVEVWGEHVGPYWASAPVALVQCAALAQRRRWPLASTLTAFLLFPVETAAGVSLHDPVYPILLVMLLLYGVAVYSSLRRALVGLTVPLLAMWTSVAVSRLLDVGGHSNASDVLFISVLVVAPWLVGRAMRGRLDEAQALARRAAELETERVRAVADERARIARELHDVLAHSVSVMVVQAGAAEQLLDTEPERSRSPLRAVQETGREALVEMSRLVGLLRTDGEEIGLAPQPGLADLEALVGQVREAGLAVEVLVEGPVRHVPLGVDLSAYRLLQEALTNTLKHAGGARATVVVRYRPDELELEVVDDGAGGGPGHSGGHGLVGMRERVAVFGGEFAAGPRPGGGFAVRARLPLEAAPA